MATPKHQRVIIWVIAAVMAVGTLGAYFIVILANNNGAVPSAAQEAYQKQLEEYQKQQAACPTGQVTDMKQPPQTLGDGPIITDVKELKTEDITVGTGQTVKAGDCVVLLFHGTLAATGKAFQGGDNYADGTPYRSLTSGFVPGFSQGLVGMNVGGERRIIIPSALGYGDQAQGEIPANSNLVFQIKLLAIQSQ